MKKKIILLSAAAILAIGMCVTVVLNYKTIRYLIPTSIKDNLPRGILTFHEDIMVPLQTIISSMRNPGYFYNVVFLPETHFAPMNLKRYSIKPKDNYTDQIFGNTKTKYYLDLFEDNIFVTTVSANIFYFNDNLIEGGDEITLNKVSSNLSDLKPDLFILDSLIEDNQIFVSGYQYDEEDGKNCKKFRIYKANINYENIKFNEIYNNNECAFAQFMQAGRIQKYNLNSAKGILFSMGENEIDKPNNLPQDEQSSYGKIIFLDLKNFETKIFSKGHRNPQGLVVDGNTVISTEHGPLGGDEINNIIEGNNYGWPQASYGTYYNTAKKKYLKSHEKFGFKEPVFTFIPAIGISEIIKIPNKFIGKKDLDNLYFVSSLNGKSLFLIKFGANNERIIFSEKIYINQRIRDLKYISKNNSVILALEHPPQLAILKNIRD